MEMTYTFGVSSDDASSLYIDGVKVANDSGAPRKIFWLIALQDFFSHFLPRPKAPFLTSAGSLNPEHCPRICNGKPKLCK
jgi:hypothetical protein